MNAKRVMVVVGSLILYGLIMWCISQSTDLRPWIVATGLLNYATFVVAVLALARK